MNRRQAITSLLVSAGGVGCSRFRAQFPQTHFAAFDLGEAAARLKSGRNLSTEIDSMGGIGRMVGAVRDRDSLVVVGRVDPAKLNPLSLADLAAALTATRNGGWPLVSIDRTVETRTSGRQAVRLENIERLSAFARTIWLADVRLKTIALFGGENLPITSLFDICLRAAQSGAVTPDISSRLWFMPKEPSLLIRDETIAIRQLHVGVRTQVVGTTGTDELSDRFAADFERHFSEISARFEEVRKLQGLFDLVAVASGARAIGANVEYFRDEYKQPKVDVPETYPVVRRQARIGNLGNHVRTLELEGGIDMHVLAGRLRAGDHIAFRDAVLRSRPKDGALTWQVPLDGWRVDGVPVEAEPGARPPEIGTQIDRRVTEPPVSRGISSIPIKPGGVIVDSPIKTEDFRRKR